MKTVLKEKDEIRKLQITGGSTYIISLPKRWVGRMGLTKGSKLILTKRDDGSILIVPENLKVYEKLSEATLLISPEEDVNSIIRKIVSSYLVGYNTIIVKTEKERIRLDQRDTIKSFVRKMLMGTEIISELPNELVMKVLLSYPELSVQSALKRMYIITASMHKDAIEALKNLNKKLAREVIAMDDEVDRFGLYIIRQLKSAVQNENIIREIGLSSGRDCLGYRLITKSVERTADHAVIIARNILMLREPLGGELFEQIKSMSKMSISVFNEAVESLFKRDFNLANSIVQRAKQIATMERKLVEPILKVGKVRDVYMLSRIMESIRRTAEHASDIAEIVLNLSVEQVIIHHQQPSKLNLHY